MTHLSNPDLAAPLPSNRQMLADVMNRLFLPFLALILVFWNLWFLLNSWALMPANDFGRILHSARAFSEGRDMYAWTRATPAKLEKDFAINLYNMNPPHIHLLFLPFTLVSEDVALGLWWVLSGLCFFHCCRWVLWETGLEMTESRRRLGLLWLLAFSGTAAILATAQLSFVLLVPISLMWLAARRGLWGWAGFFLGLTMSVKPFLAVVLAYLIYRRKGRAAIVSLLTVAGCFALGLAIFGWDNHLSWLQRLANSEGWAWLPMNASLMGMMIRTLSASIWYVPLLDLPAATVWGLWLVIGGLLGVLTLAATSRGSSPGEVDRNLALLLTASVLLCPLGWIYYLWLILPPLAALGCRFLGDKADVDKVGRIGNPSYANDGDNVRFRWSRRLLGISLLAFLWPIIGTRLFQPDSIFLRIPEGAPRPYHFEAIATLITGNIYFWGLLALWVCLAWNAWVKGEENRPQAKATLEPLDPADYRISVVLPVFSETDSVRDITTWLVRELGPRLEEIVIVQSPRSSEASQSFCRELEAEYPQVRLQRQQQNPGLGNAVREGYQAVKGNLVLNIDSDGEMEIETVHRLLQEMERGGHGLVAASRWLPGGGFSGYSRLKFLLNWGFQQMFRWLFWTRLHDLTYGFKLMRAELARGIRWQGTLHEIACETTLKPIRLGVSVAEVPSRWTARTQGASKNTFWRNFRYVRMALSVLCRPVDYSLIARSNVKCQTANGKCPRSKVKEPQILELPLNI